jgi:cytochrome bd ubiquinol oxidase subunit II
MWDLLASGPKARRQRHAIVDAIAPIWEANHVWLILVIVLLFTAFPRAFSVTMIALHIPITAMLIGIVLRGSAFVFRKFDSTEDAVQRRWSTIFGIASFFTPFFQGLTLGALTTGTIHLVGDQVTTGFFAGWLTPFALTCGLFALALFAFLAATYMTVAAQSQPDLQNDFRLRAIWAQTALIPLAIIVFTTAKYGAPLMFHGLTNWWAPLLLGWTALSAITAALALWSRKFLSGPNRCRGAGNLYSFGLGPGPISALGHTGCHYSKRRCTRVDLKAFAASPWSRCRRPIAVTLLPLSNFQRSRRALMLSWFKRTSH